MVMRMMTGSMAIWTQTTTAMEFKPSSKRLIRTETETPTMLASATIQECQSIWTPTMTPTSSLPLWKVARTATEMTRPIIVTRMTTAIV